MCSGERPIGAAKGKQSDTEALCPTPPPPAPSHPLRPPPSQVVADGDQVRVLIDKPIPKRKYTSRELNTKFYKAALLADCITDSEPAQCLPLPAMEGMPPGNNLTWEGFQVGEHKILLRRSMKGVGPQPQRGVCVWSGRRSRGLFYLSEP